MISGGRARLLPQPEQAAVPWDYFLLDVARGGNGAPVWLLGALCVVISERLGLPVDAVEEGHIEEVAAHLPPRAPRWLEGVLFSFRLTTGGLGRPLVPPDLVGTPAKPVPAHTLVHDAGLAMRDGYAPERLPALVAGLDEAGPVALVEASLYLLLLMEGEPEPVEAPAPEPGKSSLWIRPTD